MDYVPDLLDYIAHRITPWILSFEITQRCDLLRQWLYEACRLLS
jgi:hypothetical protein